MSVIITDALGLNQLILFSGLIVGCLCAAQILHLNRHNTHTLHLEAAVAQLSPQVINVVGTINNAVRPNVSF